MLIAAVIVEVLSLLVMWFIILMFRRARTRQRDFFLLLYGIDPDADPVTYPEPVARLVSHIDFPFLLWTYVILTVLLTIVTVGIFILQPHWL